MGKQKNTVKGGEKAHISNSPTLSSHVGEAGDPCDAGQDLMDEVASLEEALSQMGTSSQMSFPFTHHSGLPLEWFLSAEHRVDPSANEYWMCYCIYVKVILEEGRGDWFQPPHTWTSSLIADIFQEGLEERITKALVLAPGEAILFFGRQSLKERLPHTEARDIAFSMAGPLIWAGRQTQMKMAVDMVQEGCWAFADAVVEKRMETWGSGHPQGKKKINIEDWMQGIEEDDSEVELRNGRAGNHKADPRNAWSQNVSRGRRHPRRQGRPLFPQDALDGSPSSRGEVQIN